MRVLSKAFCRVSLMVLLSLSFGCGTSAPVPAKKAAVDTGHDHGHAAPHGGTVADWGGGAFHVEFTVDHPKKEATVYVLGSDGKTAAPVKTPKIRLILLDPATEIELTAKPLEGEAEGSSSRFVGTHDNLGIVKEFAGTISGEVAGTPYVGEFKEVAGDHGHAH